MMFKNTIVIEVEDLHSNVIDVKRGLFPNLKTAIEFCQKLNDYYAEHCIPRIACVKD